MLQCPDSSRALTCDRERWGIRTDTQCAYEDPEYVGISGFLDGGVPLHEDSVRLWAFEPCCSRYGRV